ncbi:hypothetical protein GCM10025857_14270 [Alicyclobacillus contaminans]|nr:hypothetical protein GCM10025857_14270 [Alicyclobacillus contaminans]
MAAGLMVACVVAGTVQGWPWWATGVAVLALLLFALLETYERQAMNPKQIALVASIAAVASVGRVVVQGIPSVQPATFIILMAGYMFGPGTGAAVGAFTALGSNLFLGEGVWTPWQMLAWGLVGATAGWLHQWFPRWRVWWLVPFAFLWGYVFGWIMNLQVLLGGGPISWAAYGLLCVRSVWFDTNHALTTAALTAVAGPVVMREFERYRRRMQVHRSAEGALSNRLHSKGEEES